MKLGFCERCIDLIMNCVTSVSYSVLVNGKLGGVFSPTRGLRQGDPLSTYLFIIYAEGLSTLLNHSDQNGFTRGVVMARGGTKVNHLVFVDDCVLFDRARVDEWKQVAKDYLRL